MKEVYLNLYKVKRNNKKMAVTFLTGYNVIFSFRSKKIEFILISLL